MKTCKHEDPKYAEVDQLKCLVKFKKEADKKEEEDKIINAKIAEQKDKLAAAKARIAAEKARVEAERLAAEKA